MAVLPIDLPIIFRVYSECGRMARNQIIGIAVYSAVICPGKDKFFYSILLQRSVFILCRDISMRQDVPAAIQGKLFVQLKFFQIPEKKLSVVRAQIPELFQRNLSPIHDPVLILLHKILIQHFIIIIAFYFCHKTFQYR